MATCPDIKYPKHPRGEADWAMSANSYKSHDLAMVVLKEPVRFGPTVRPVCLPQQGSEYGGQLVVAAGWGRSGP
jgi:complement component 1 s subcomponent